MESDVAVRIAEARAVLRAMLARVEAGEDGIYGNRSRALSEILAALQSDTFAGVRWLLLPTGNLQELSLDNGWGEEFLEMAQRLKTLLELA